MQHIQRIFQNKPKIFRCVSQFQMESKHYLIRNEITDDDRMIQILTDRGNSCGDRGHAILITTHSTVTQQTQYTDNKATLNEKQFFSLGKANSWRSCRATGKGVEAVVDTKQQSRLMDQPVTMDRGTMGQPWGAWLQEVRKITWTLGPP